MVRLERYLEEKGLDINANKTKIMRNKKGERGGEGKDGWKG